MALIASLLPVGKRLMLHDDLQTQNDLQNGFADICRNFRSMIHVKMSWPGKDVIDTMPAGRSIYATTVLRFVTQKSTRPIKQLLDTVL